MSLRDEIEKYFEQQFPHTMPKGLRSKIADQILALIEKEQGETWWVYVGPEIDTEDGYYYRSTSLAFKTIGEAKKYGPSKSLTLPLVPIRLPAAKQEEDDRLPCGCKPEYLCECPENNDYSAYAEEDEGEVTSGPMAGDPSDPPNDQGEREAMGQLEKLAKSYSGAQWALDRIKKLEGELENAARVIDEERRARKEWVKSFEKADSANDKLLAENSSLKEQLAQLQAMNREAFMTKALAALDKRVANLESKHEVYGK